MNHSTTRSRVRISTTDLGGYFVSVESADGLHICNDELLTKQEARQLAAQVAQQLELQRLAAEAVDNRMARALAIVADGKVRRTGKAFIVNSQTADHAYYVDGKGCDCPDATYNKPSGGCKHQIAVKLYERMEARPSELAAMDADLAAYRRNPQPVQWPDVASQPIGLDESRCPYRY